MRKSKGPIQEEARVTPDGTQYVLLKQGERRCSVVVPLDEVSKRNAGKRVINEGKAIERDGKVYVPIGKAKRTKARSPARGKIIKQIPKE